MMAWRYAWAADLKRMVPPDTRSCAIILAACSARQEKEKLVVSKPLEGKDIALTTRWGLISSAHEARGTTHHLERVPVLLVLWSW